MEIVSWHMVASNLVAASNPKAACPSHTIIRSILRSMKFEVSFFHITFRKDRQSQTSSPAPFSPARWAWQRGRASRAPVAPPTLQAKEAEQWPGQEDDRVCRQERRQGRRRCRCGGRGRSQQSRWGRALWRRCWPTLQGARKRGREPAERWNSVKCFFYSIISHVFYARLFVNVLSW